MNTWSTTTVLVILKTWWARITRSRLTVTFLIFVLAIYAVQTTLHSAILSHYIRKRRLVTAAIDATDFRRGFPSAHRDVLRICYGIPTVRGTTCHTACSYSDVANSTVPGAVSLRCAAGLSWLEKYLRTTQCEEVVYLVFQSWLAAHSFIALLDESIPHLIVVVVAQLVNMGWIVYRIIRDGSARRTFERLVVDGACAHFDILEGSWRNNGYYLALGVSIVALGMLFFVLKLAKLYSNETLSSVGTSAVIDRLRKWRLWMRVFIFFSAFFILTSATIWFNDRRSNMIAPYSKNYLYDAAFYSVIVMIWPWVTLGTHSITSEKRLLFLAYAFLSICLLVISSLWFGSALFRYEFEEWRFFTCVTGVADVLLVVTCILSVVCRVNFGQGLAHFLDVERALRASGFAQDTFLRNPSKCKQQSLVSSDSEILPPPVIDIRRLSADASKEVTRPVSSRSIAAGCGACASSQGGEHEKKRKSQLEKVEEGSMCIIVTKMKPLGTHFIIEDESGSSGDKDS